ncbi:MAG: oxygen-independent coproporphyrinogen III oxidase [Limisphaerales bacterium]
MNALTVNLDLVKKYNVPGPRYTSYPPATKFTDALDWDRVLEKIAANNRDGRDLSLYFHIPFCETLCWFCGCTTVITNNHGQASSYLDHLEKEASRMAAQMDRRRRVTQLHWGGGSPTFLRPEEILRLGGIIHKYFSLSEDAEAGVEIDPRRLTREHVAALREIGFNRASLGVQDFEPKVQEAIHRIQPRDLTQRTLDWTREMGFGSVNFDLIYGLPHQTVESFGRTLDTVLEMGPDRLAVFSYAHVPWIKPAQKILEQKVLPTPEAKLQLLKMATERLTENGRYVYIGMDHFARPGDELVSAQRNKTLRRNFQGYSTRGNADIFAFGMSAISEIPDAYWQNQKELSSYYAALDNDRAPFARGYVLADEDKIRRETIMRVMCDLSLDYAAMSKNLGIDFAGHFAKELAALAPFETDGLVQFSYGGLTVTDTGRMFIRNIAMCFDNTLAPSGERKHSRTV